MLNASRIEPAACFEDLRQREFPRLAAHGLAYLDYAGSALYADSQLRAHQEILARGLFGNPHSAHAPSLASTAVIHAARRRVLEFLDAPAADSGDESDYVVCFTANTSAAVKLVAESYPFGPGTSCVLSADNHNSVNGIREYARRAGSAVRYVPLDEDLRLRGALAVLADSRGPGGGLFAFPAQSNFSGVRHPLSLVARAKELGFDVLLDIAAFAPSHPFSLRRCPADFVALSFYKLFGYPTGVGALVARRTALARLERPWFAGGTVLYASVQNLGHRLRPMEDGFEDGTPDFLSIAALEPGFAFLAEVGMEQIEAHTERLTAFLLDELRELRHRDGSPLVRIYGPVEMAQRGATLAFNIVDRHGRVLAYPLIEERARAEGVALRGGCFCNPGAAEAAFGFDSRRAGHCLEVLGSGFDIERFRGCLGGTAAVGAVRISVGLANDTDDIRRAVAMVTSFRE